MAIQIELAPGIVTVVDDRDAFYGKGKKLTTKRVKNRMYVQGKFPWKDDWFLLHREIFQYRSGYQLGEYDQVYHKDGDGLNNQFENLVLRRDQTDSKAGTSYA